MLTFAGRRVIVQHAFEVPRWRITNNPGCRYKTAMLPPSWRAFEQIPDGEGFLVGDAVIVNPNTAAAIRSGTL